jgi:hypothetical protein
MRFNLTRGKATLLLAVIWVAVQAVLVYTNHVGTIHEAEKYITEARNLADGQGLGNRKYIFYILPIFLIFISTKANLGFSLAIGIQLAANALATLAFFKTAQHIWGNRLKSVITTLLYITFIPLQQWNSFLYTESLFYSLCVLFIYLTVVYPPYKTRPPLALIAVILLMVFTRPMGLFIIPVLLFSLLYKIQISKKVKWLITLATAILLYTTLNFLYNSGSGMNILLPQTEGMVLCDVGQAIATDHLTLPTTHNPINSLALFIFYNPVYFSKLALLRLISFFNLTRQEYSFGHNLYFSCYMVFLYVLTFVSYWFSKTTAIKPLRYTFLPILLILAAGVMLQCNEYNNRFSLTLFPWFILFAADGLYTIVGGFNTKAQKPPPTIK